MFIDLQKNNSKIWKKKLFPLLNFSFGNTDLKKIQIIQNKSHLFPE